MPMSAADPADPTRSYLNTGGRGAVIDISKHRPPWRGTAADEARGRWTAMNTPPDHGPRPDRTPLELVADDVEVWLNAIRESLTDERTAAVYVRTLEFVEHILHGAVAQEMITEQQRSELADLLAAAKQAPRLV